MLLIDLFELFKLMRFVRVTKQTTVWTDRNLARLAVIAQCRVMLTTELLPALLSLVLLLLHHLHHICEETARYELVRAQTCPAVWALGPGLLDPLSQTVLASKFRAMRAHHCILNRAKANEATEEFIKLDLIVGSPTSTIRTSSCVNRLNAWSAIIRSGWSQRWYIIIIWIIVKDIMTYLMVEAKLFWAITSLYSTWLFMFFNLLQDIFDLLLL